MYSEDAAAALQVLPYFLVFLPFAIGNWFVAGALGQSRILWVILSLIPVVNLIFLYYVVYAVALRILRKLEAISQRLDGREPV